MKLALTSLLLLASAAVALAGPVAAPEIDGNSATSAITLICGAALILRSRR
jgi:hypothetical protein